MRHALTLISHVKRMRMANFTLGEIMAKTGLSKTTIYHHIKTFPKSQILVGKISSINRAIQKMQADKRRGKSVKKYKFFKPKKWTADFVNLVAHFLFDGEIRYSSCIYNNRSRSLIDNLTQLMKSVIGVDDFKFIHKPDGVRRVSYHNVEIADFMKKKAAELLKYIPNSPFKHKTAFLKAFFDDEGSMRFVGNKRVARGYQHSIEILRLIQCLLADLRIESKIDEKYWEIDIGRKENLIKFQKHIDFSRGIYVNGNRSNSIWKKDLEKREILKMALASYKT